MPSPSTGSFVLSRALGSLGSAENASKGKGGSALWRIVAQPIPSEGLTSPRVRSILPSPNPRPFSLRPPIPLPSPLPPPFPARQKTALRTRNTGEHAIALEIVLSLIDDNLISSESASSLTTSEGSYESVTRKMIKKVESEATTELSCNVYGHGSSTLDIAFERALQEQRGSIRREELALLYTKASRRLLLCSLELQALETTEHDATQIQEADDETTSKPPCLAEKCEEGGTGEKEVVLNSDATNGSSSSSTLSSSSSPPSSSAAVIKDVAIIAAAAAESLIEASSSSSASPVGLTMITSDATAAPLVASDSSSNDDQLIVTPVKVERRRNNNNNNSTASSSSSPLEYEVDVFETVSHQAFVKKALFSEAKEDSALPSKPIPTRYNMHVWGAKDDIDDVLKNAGWELARHAHHRVYKREILFPDGTKREQTFVRPVASGHDRMKDRSMHKDLKKREDEALDAFNEILEQMKKSKKSGKAGGANGGSKKVWM